MSGIFEREMIDVGLRLERDTLLSLIAAASPDPSTIDPQSKLAYADYLISSHSRRHFAAGEERISEPCLNILLDLYAAHHRNRSVDITSLSIACGAPFSSGLRYVDKLVAMGLAERKADPRDKRRVFITLPPSTRDAIDDWLETEIQHLCKRVLTGLLSGTPDHRS